MPPLYVAVVDSLNQIVRSLSPAPIQLLFEESTTGPSPPSTIAHFVSRKNEAKWTQGAFIIENTTLVGEPGRHYSLKIESLTVIDQSKPEAQEAAQQFGSNFPLSDIHFSFCDSGEAYLKTGECQLCPPKSYLFHSHTTPTDCLACPLNARCFGGEDIGPVPGYWRSDKYSLAFLSCFNSAACLGSLHPVADSDSSL